jgi:tetratricopeptide (TPR) repeat protein
MAARQHSRFVHFALPWLIAAGALALYLTTLNRWMSLDSVSLASKIAGWDWSSVQMGGVTLLVTWPARWLPPQWQLLALNAMSAVFGAVTLGLLAKSVALLPHDRTREQRQRERSDFSFLTIPTAWIPPLAAATLLGFQLTFWEHSTVMTGEALNVAMFAFCVYCFLRFRVLQEDGYLAALSFVFGAACANDWGMAPFAPLFLVAIIWAKGIAFFEAGFLIRTSLAGLAGLLFYLVEPLALTMTDQAEGSFFEVFRTLLSIQRNSILLFPRFALIFCGATSILPVVFMAIRWPSSFGDMSAAGSALTNVLFRVIHAAFLVACVWAMFDPPFSPRERGFGLPFLRFYFLTALAVGYMLGYILLVFGQEPERKMKRPSEGMLVLGRMAAAVIGIASLGAAAGLAYYNWPAIRGQNGTLVRDLAETLAPRVTEPVVLLSDEHALLMLATGAMRERSPDVPVIPIQTDLLKLHVYQRQQERAHGNRWPALALDQLTDPLTDDNLILQVYALSFSNRVFYLHPSFGYYFEAFRMIPTNTVYELVRTEASAYKWPRLSDDHFESVHQQWARLRDDFVKGPTLERLKERRVKDAVAIGAHFSRAFNFWGVELQRRDRLDEALEFFQASLDLFPQNLGAEINKRFNANLRAGKRDAVAIESEFTPMHLRVSGAIDEPSHCFKIGRIFHDSHLSRQAARYFDRCLDLQPNSAETRLWLASATLNAKLYDETLRVIQEARAANPDLPSALQIDLVRLESWARFYKGDLEKAEELLLEAQHQFPEHVLPLQTLNEIYITANRTNSALAAVERLIQRQPDDVRPLITKSAIQIQSGALVEAIQTLNAILEKQPGFFPALVNRALAYSRLDRLDDAARDYRELLEIAPNLNVVYYHLAEIDFQQGKMASARKHYRQFLEKALPNSPEARAAKQRLEQIASGKSGG